MRPTYDRRPTHRNLADPELGGQVDLHIAPCCLAAPASLVGDREVTFTADKHEAFTLQLHRLYVSPGYAGLAPPKLELDAFLAKAELTWLMVEPVNKDAPGDAGNAKPKPDLLVVGNDGRNQEQDQQHDEKGCPGTRPHRCAPAVFWQADQLAKLVDKRPGGVLRFCRCGVGREPGLNICP